MSWRGQATGWLNVRWDGLAPQAEEMECNSAGSVEGF